MTLLTDSVRIGSLTLKNRLYRAPVLEGAGLSKDPAGVYAKHFVKNARAGVGLIIQGNTIVTAEGRTSPGMTNVAEPDDLLCMRKMTDAVHAAGAAVMIQLGHGGLYAIEGWHHPYVDERTRPPMAPSQPPLLLRVVHRRVHVPSTEEIAALVARFGVVAGWAKEAGYDAIQLASGNAKLLHQFLSRTYNRRTDRYGGSLEARFQILREIRETIAGTCGPEFPVTIKLCTEETGPFGGGITAEEGIELARLAATHGFDAITPASAGALPDTALCRGDHPAASFENARVKRTLRSAAGRIGAAGIEFSMKRGSARTPFAPVWNRSTFVAVKQAVDVPVFAVGGIRTPAEGAQILASGEADLIGVGRPFYAEPELARWFLAQDVGRVARCENCNRCVVPQMLGMPGVCYNPASQAPRAERAAAAK
jgi:2,4-dienoyl-CoA reductase-like NADH-dependent reductase (Old Yellow Enzyme family)